MKEPNFLSPYASTLTRTGMAPANPKNGKGATLDKLGAAEYQQRAKRLARKALRHEENTRRRAELHREKANAGSGKADLIQQQIDSLSSYKFV